MYFSRSQAFSQEFKAKALVAIEKQITEFRGYTDEMFAKIVGSYGFGESQMAEVKLYGHRWKDAERVYHAMIAGLERRMMNERGPGMLTESEAKGLEAMFMLPTTGYMFDIAAAEGIRSAASTDYWYMFEKQWD